MSGVLDRLAGMLTQATPADLAELDTEIARLQGVRELVARALALPAPVSVMQVAKPRAITTHKHRDSQMQPRRAAVARALAEAGALGTAELARRCGIPEGTMQKVMQCPWFKKATDNKFSPWELTDSGRAALKDTEPGKV